MGLAGLEDRGPDGVDCPDRGGDLPLVLSGDPDHGPEMGISLAPQRSRH